MFKFLKLKYIYIYELWAIFRVASTRCLLRSRGTNNRYVYMIYNRTCLYERRPWILVCKVETNIHRSIRVAVIATGVSILA